MGDILVNTVYLRDVDGTGSMHACSKGDPGAIAHIPDNTESWQDIATAPKNGREFLACWSRQGNVFQLVYWNRVHNYWVSKGVIVHGFENNATHWMPLPNPPKITGGE